MIQLFKNIENYKNLSLKDMGVVARNFVYFVPQNKAIEYSKKAMPLAAEAHEKVRRCLSTFESERKELSSIIEKYFDEKYFQEQKNALQKNMFDTNYALKGLLNEMSVKQLCDFGRAMIFGHACADLFMTSENFYGYTWDLSVEAGTVMQGGTFEKLEYVPKGKIINIYLRYIDLNIILADNVAEQILDGVELNDVYKYITDVLELKYQNLYKVTILM